jgi:Protein of unknown function (DUF2800).
MACPGSVRLSRQVPTPPTTPYAEEGTRAHALAELTLRDLGDASIYLGETIEGGVVTEDMIAAVQVYVDHCFEIARRPGVSFWVERRFSLAELDPPEPMFGTSDFVAYEPAVRTLHVSDLKYGQGVLVEVLGSKQLRYYALGGLLSLGPMRESMPVEQVRMTIVQPRIGHPDGLVRTEEIGVEELLAFAVELMTAAKRTQEPDAPLVAGSHCRFCPASGICPAQVEHAQSIAQIEFSVEPNTPPAPETMPLEMVLSMLPQLDVLEDWIGAMRSYVQTKLERGEEVPGWKLIARRATRKWTGPEAVADALKARGYADEEIFKQELKSPAQIEKLMGKKAFSAHPISALVEKKSSGHKMAPANDPAPAITVTRGEEFAALMDGE